MPERGAGLPAWPARRRGHGAVRVAAALALHAALLAALWSGLGRVELTRPAHEVWTSLVAFADQAAPARPPAQVSPPVTKRSRPPAAPAFPAARRAPVREPHAITLSTPPAASAALASAAPASAPSASIASILDTDATRAAILAVARGPLLSERVAAATGIAPAAGPNERLAQGVDAAKHGDCLKGDYPFGGGGLLSLPFLAVAAATGKCAK